MQFYVLDAIRKAEDFLNHMNFRSMATKVEVLRKAPQQEATQSFQQASRQECGFGAKKNPESQNLAQWGCVGGGILGWIISGQLPS